jgi:hypothetical protein
MFLSTCSLRESVKEKKITKSQNVHFDSLTREGKLGGDG